MYLPLQTEALSLRLHGNGLGIHALVNRICRNLVAERVHRPFGIAQIVILVHFGVERIQAGQQLLNLDTRSRRTAWNAAYAA